MRVLVTVEGGTMADDLQEVEGYVWCDNEGCVHEDTLNPYDMSEESWCEPQHHRKLYMEPDV
jgi:hypothetical protein